MLWIFQFKSAGFDFAARKHENKTNKINKQQVASSRAPRIEMKFIRKRENSCGRNRKLISTYSQRADGFHTQTCSAPLRIHSIYIRMRKSLD